MRLATAGLLAAYFISPQISVAYIGVPLNVIVACAAGAYSSFSFGDRVEPRSRMFRLFFTCILMGCAFTAVVNAGIAHWTELKMTDGLQAGVGAIVSCLTRFWLVWIVDTIRSGKWVNFIPFVKNKVGE